MSDVRLRLIVKIDFGHSDFEGYLLFRPTAEIRSVSIVQMLPFRIKSYFVFQLSDLPFNYRRLKKCPFFLTQCLCISCGVIVIH